MGDKNKPDPITTTACFLFDLDGTIYLGDTLLPGAEKILDYLEEIGTPYFFLTNNSSRSRQDYVKKLRGLGLSVERERIISSGLATALYLKDQKPNARIYLVGTPSLEVEFEEYGFQLVDQDPDFAVLGFDTTLTYRKIRTLVDFILEGIPYIATHPDINCPTPEGDIPDIGAMMAMIEASTGKEADRIIGKPHAPMMEVVTKLTNLKADQITMVGDRLYTDIALGRWGVRTVLVLSGETKREDLPGEHLPPDLVCEGLDDLLDILRVV